MTSNVDSQLVQKVDRRTEGRTDSETERQMHRHMHGVNPSRVHFQGQSPQQADGKIRSSMRGFSTVFHSLSCSWLVSASIAASGTRAHRNSCIHECSHVKAQRQVHLHASVHRSVCVHALSDLAELNIQGSGGRHVPSSERLSALSLPAKKRQNFLLLLGVVGNKRKQRKWST